MTLGQTDRFLDRQTNRRRGPNPLTRSYDSRGPEVRIRGTALHVAERYLQLARDAHTASNPVAAENYLQHAEHYFRLMATAQAEQLEGQTSDGRATGHSAPEDLDDGDNLGIVNLSKRGVEGAPNLVRAIRRWRLSSRSRAKRQRPAHAKRGESQQW